MGRQSSTKEGVDKRSLEIREKYLCDSGGWLGELVSALSNITGVWDVLILCVIIIPAWVIMRTASMEVCVVLGFAFDLVIPLQYYCDKTVHPKHRAHLIHYWPIISVANLLEIAAYILIHPDLFTLFACLKTFACTTVWLGVKENGIYLSTSIGRKGLPANRSSSGASGTSSASSSVSRSNGPSKEGGSEKEGGWWADMNDLLSTWGYDDQLGRSGMIDHISKTSADKRAGILDKWSTAASGERRRRMKKYADELLEDREDLFETMPRDSRVPDADQKLRKLFPDPLVRYGMISALKRNRDDQQVVRNLERWTTEEEHVSRRTAQYLKKAEEKLGIRRGENNGTRTLRGVPELPRIKLPIQNAQERIEREYKDPMTVWGMMDYLSTLEEHKAKGRLKIWEFPDQTPEDKKRREREYRERAEEMMEILHPTGSLGGSGFSEGRIKEVEGIMKDHDIHLSDREIILDAFKGQRTARQEAAITSRLKRLGMKWKIPDKYSADIPIQRPAGGKTVSGLPNEWMDELDHRLYDVGAEDRRQTLDLFERGAKNYEESKKKRDVFKKIKDLSPPGTPGSYDTFGGRLEYSHDELFQRRRALEEAGYMRQTIHPMLADFKNQSSREVAEGLFKSWIEASKDLEKQRRVVLDYQPKTMPVSLW